MNLIPVIREALGLQEHEEFNLKNDRNVVFPDKFRFTDSTLQIKEGERWVEAHSMMFKLLFKGEYEVAKLPFKPKEGEKYYWVQINKKIGYGYFYAEYQNDCMRYSLKNYFRTKEEITPEVLEETWRRCYGKYIEEEE